MSHSYLLFASKKVKNRPFCILIQHFNIANIDGTTYYVNNSYQTNYTDSTLGSVRRPQGTRRECKGYTSWYSSICINNSYRIIIMFCYKGFIETNKVIFENKFYAFSFRKKVICRNRERDEKHISACFYPNIKYKFNRVV